MTEGKVVKLLILDDSPAELDLVRSTLDEDIFKAVLVNTLSEALRVVDLGERFDAFVIDHDLGFQFTGLSAINALRCTHHDALYILFTANSSPEVAAKAQAMGVHLVPKTYDLTLLQRTLSDLLGVTATDSP